MQFLYVQALDLGTVYGVDTPMATISKAKTKASNAKQGARS